MIAVNLIGAGRIGGAVAEWLATAPGFRLGAVIGRDAADWPPAPLTLDCAGPAALQAYGARALEGGEVWTVGAAALIDAGLRDDLTAIATRTGHRLRLFTPWIAGPALCPPGVPAALHVSQWGPGLAPEPGLLFEGPLAEAARHFPHHLNTATAAALTGPGIGATTIALHALAPGGAHRIAARFEMPGQVITTEVSFDGAGLHPVAQALIAALARRGAALGWG